MKIPIDAINPAEKLTKYLLAARPKDDKSRYLARAGFDQSNAAALEVAIRLGIASVDAVMDRISQYGTFYKVRCELIGPSGIGIRVVLIWLCRLDGVHSFVTLVSDTETQGWHPNFMMKWRSAATCPRTG